MRQQWCVGFALCLAWVGNAVADPPTETPCPIWHSGWYWASSCPPPPTHANSGGQVCGGQVCVSQVYDWHSGWCRTSSCPPIGCCPDDYARKPCPNIAQVGHCGGPDDYCRKPMPDVTCVPHCGGPDDYCRKPMPCLLCPPITPYLRCGPADGPCSPYGKR